MRRKKRVEELGERGPQVGYGVAVMVAATLSGCSIAHMKPPSEVGQGVDEVRVIGLSSLHGALFNEDFAIGPDQVQHVSRGIEVGERSRTFFGFEKHEQTGYSYDVARGDRRLHGECGVETSESGTKIGKITFLGRTVRVGCACGDPEAPQATMELALSDGQERGTMRVGEGGYEVRPIHELDGGGQLVPPAGYRVDGDGFVGAVDTLQPGHVWLDKMLEPDRRSQLTCLFAGLLLYVPKHP